MTPIMLNHTAQSYSPYDATPQADTPPVSLAWLHSREHQATSALRGPLLAAAQRVGLASSRCDELQEQIDNTRHALLNRPAWMTTAEVMALESRIMQSESELHRERQSLWKDLQPLAEMARDAGVEQIKQSWLRDVLGSLGDAE
jgi:hypothetical protein